MSKDTIYRQAAIDALDEYFVRIGKLKRRGLNKGEKAIRLDTVGAINSLPSAQPELIRCKDCKHYTTEFCAIDLWTDEVKIYKARPDDFCSRAERRRDDQGIDN